MKVEKAGVLILRNNGDKQEVLLECDTRYDYWLLPKGHIEKGETSEEAAIREAKEETGLEVKILRRLSDIEYKDNDKNDVILYMFLADIVAGEVTPENDDFHLEWFDLRKAKGRVTYPEVKKAIEGYIKDKNV